MIPFDTTTFSLVTNVCLVGLASPNPSTYTFFEMTLGICYTANEGKAATRVQTCNDQAQEED